MKKQQVDHVLRAAGRITGERQFIIIGSQSLHGKYPDLADQILKSVEVDLIAGKKGTRTEWLNAIGHLSPFHESFGYYADRVDLTAATLPEGWKRRLVHLPPGDTEGVRGLCLEPHDLVIAKYAAAREKDRIFTRELARLGIVSEERLLSLLEQTRVDEEAHERMRSDITRDFHLEKDLGVDQERSGAGKQPSTADPHAIHELGAIRTRGREDRLNVRPLTSEKSPTRKRARASDLERNDASKHTGGEE